MLKMLALLAFLPVALAYDNTRDYLLYKRRRSRHLSWLYRMTDATIQAIAVAITSVAGLLAYLLGKQHGEAASNGQPAKPCDCAPEGK